MSDLKNFSSEDELRVYLSFRLVGSGRSYREEKSSLEATLQRLFPDGVKLDHEDPEGPQDRELVYGIPKPLLDTPEELRGFFLRMQELFKEHDSFLPAFTQGSEAFA